MKQNTNDSNEVRSKDVRSRSVLLVEGSPLFHFLLVESFLEISQEKIQEIVNQNKMIAFYCKDINQERYIDMSGFILLAMELDTKPAIDFKKWAKEVLWLNIYNPPEILNELKGPHKKIQELIQLRWE